eukprot:scaffold4764_cov46-Tisochrysis_lutea.AAC.1
MPHAPSKDILLVSIAFVCPYVSQIVGDMMLWGLQSFVVLGPGWVWVGREDFAVFLSRSV